MQAGGTKASWPKGPMHMLDTLAARVCTQCRWTQHAAPSIGTAHSWSWLSIVVPVALHNSIFKTVCTGHVLILLAFVLLPCCVAFCALSSST